MCPSANPIGSAIGQLIPPFISTPKHSVYGYSPPYLVLISDTLVLGIDLGHNDFHLLSSSLARAIQTSKSTEYVVISLQRIGLSIDVRIAYSGSQPSPPVSDTLLAWVGKETKRGSSMSGTERLDFTILVVLFGVLVAAVSTFSIFTNQIFVSPHLLPNYGGSHLQWKRRLKDIRLTKPASW